MWRHQSMARSLQLSSSSLSRTTELCSDALVVIAWSAASQSHAGQRAHGPITNQPAQVLFVDTHLIWSSQWQSSVPILSLRAPLHIFGCLFIKFYRNQKQTVSIAVCPWEVSFSMFMFIGVAVACLLQPWKQGNALSFGHQCISWTFKLQTPLRSTYLQTYKKLRVVLPNDFFESCKKWIVMNMTSRNVTR